MSALDALLGRSGEPPKCTEMRNEIAVHWFPTGAKLGDRCLCGATIMTAVDPGEAGDG